MVRLPLRLGRQEREGHVVESDEDGEIAPAWERQTGEPSLWYERFEEFRRLGADRTLAEAYRRRSALEGLRGREPSFRWYRAAQRWAWRERAQAWDRSVREELRAQEAELCKRAHERRLDMIDTVTRIAFQCLRRADLEGMDKEEARARLPAVRLLFRDGINELRKELGMPERSEGDDERIAPFTADELLAAQRELGDWQGGEEDGGEGVTG